MMPTPLPALAQRNIYGEQLIQGDYALRLEPLLLPMQRADYGEDAEVLMFTVYRVVTAIERDNPAEKTTVLHKFNDKAYWTYLPDDAARETRQAALEVYMAKLAPVFLKSSDTLHATCRRLAGLTEKGVLAAHKRLQRRSGTQKDSP